MPNIKDHPFAIGFMLSILSGEYWAIRLMPTDPTASDWLFALAIGPCFIVVTMFPVAFFIVLAWSALGWWD